MSRKRKARLGKVAPATTTGEKRLYHVTSDGKCIQFRQIWAREGDAISLSLSDVLDFGLNRRFVDDKERTIQFGFCRTGIHIRVDGKDTVIPFRDIIDLSTGQLLLPTA
ncbi:MAG: hypothetical protein IT581_12175 [Verrucomicrobiales bacterium]|nr:hypothetical protein [Verrucomicrobiales bacterium]